MTHVKRPGGRRSATMSVAFAVGMFWAGTSAAADIDVQVRGCRSPVALKAHDAPLADVLARLSTALDFKLRVEGAVDARVNVDMSAPAPALIAAIAGMHGSFMLGHAGDARCPGMTRVSMLWLTPKAAGSPRVADDQFRAKVTPVTETATPERLRVVEADSLRLKAAFEAYVKQHGKSPPGEPEEAAAP